MTIALMGIVFAVASSTWFGVVESRRVDSGTNQVAADLRLAHTRASNQLAEYRVAYVSSGNINCAGRSATDPDPVARPDYCLLQQNGGAYQQTARFLPESTLISGTGLNVDSVISTLLGSANVRTVKFNADGTAASGGGLPAGTAVIRLTVASDDGSPSHAIDVNRATSRTKVDP